MHSSACKWIATELSNWFRESARPMPWRDSKDPYRVLVSEIMLQQTRASVVAPYFQRFMAAFPSLSDLRDADEQSVLMQWSGLGYYRRAKSLHALSRQVEAIPQTAQELRALPGIGDYTAAAVASIAFGEAVPAVDGNATRVCARLFGIEETGADRTKAIASVLRSVLGHGEPHVITQAVMELGAVVCKPTNPACQDCPLSRRCVARKTGRVHALPTRAVLKKLSNLSHVSVVPVFGDKIGVQEIKSGWWAGMYQFPRTEAAEGEEPESAAVRLLGAPVRPLVSFTHHVTNYRIRLFGYWAKARPKGLIWKPANEMRCIPLPAPQKRLYAAFVRSVLFME